MTLPLLGRLYRIKDVCRRLSLSNAPTLALEENIPMTTEIDFDTAFTTGTTIPFCRLHNMCQKLSECASYVPLH